MNLLCGMGGRVRQMTTRLPLRVRARPAFLSALRLCFFLSSWTISWTSNAGVDLLLECFDDRRVGEFVDAGAQRFAFLGRGDELEAGLKQAARQPLGVLVLRIVHLLVGRLVIAELARIGLARDGAAVEPNAMLAVVFRLGLDLERELVAKLERARRAERRKHLELIGRCRLRGEVAPQEALNRKFVGEVGAFLRVWLRNDRFEHLQGP